MLFSTPILTDLGTRKYKEGRSLLAFPFLSRKSNDLVADYAELCVSYKIVNDSISELNRHIRYILKEYGSSGTFIYRDIIKSVVKNLVGIITIKGKSLNLSEVHMELRNKEVELRDTFYTELMNEYALCSDKCFDKFCSFYDDCLQALESCRQKMEEMGYDPSLIEIDVKPDEDFFRREGYLDELNTRCGELRLIPSLTNLINISNTFKEMDSYYQNFLELVNQEQNEINPKEFLCIIQESIDYLAKLTGVKDPEYKVEKQFRKEYDKIFDDMYKHFRVDKEIILNIRNKLPNFNSLPRGNSISSMLDKEKAFGQALLDSYTFILFNCLKEMFSNSFPLKGDDSIDFYAMCIADCIVRSYYDEVLEIPLLKKDLENSIRDVKIFFDNIINDAEHKYYEISFEDFLDLFEEE